MPLSGGVRPPKILGAPARIFGPPNKACVVSLPCFCPCWCLFSQEKSSSMVPPSLALSIHHPSIRPSIPPSLHPLSLHHPLIHGCTRAFATAHPPEHACAPCCVPPAPLSERSTGASGRRGQGPGQRPHLALPHRGSLPVLASALPRAALQPCSSQET